MTQTLLHVAEVAGSVLLFRVGADALYRYVEKAKARLHDQAGRLHSKTLMSKLPSARSNSTPATEVH